MGEKLCEAAVVGWSTAGPVAQTELIGVSCAEEVAVG